MSRKTRLRHLLTINPRLRMPSGVDDSTEVMFLPMENLNENGTFSSEIRRRVADVRDGYSNFEDGDIALAKVTPCFENGKAAILDEVGTSIGFGTTEITVIRPHEGISTEYLFYVLKSEGFLEGGKASMTGAGGLKRVPDSYIRNFAIDLPSKSIQDQLVGFLNRETAQIDELIAKQELLLDLLAERRQSFISQALTSETGQGTRESGVHWLGEIPASWDLRRFGQVVQIQEGQVDPQDEQYADWLLLAPNHIQKATGRILSLETASEQGASSGKYLANKGTVVYSKIRPRLRKAALAPKTCLISADMYALNADPKLLRNEFLLLLVLSNQFSLFTASSSERVAMPKINRETLAQGWVWYPSLQRQEEILLDVAENNSRVDALAERAAEMIALLKERRQALISAAVTGKIDVTGKA